MKILGISAYYHDSAASLVVDGKIIAAAQEERFTRIKHDPAFPAQAIKYCLDEGGLHLSEIDAIAFYDKPFLKFERLLETYYVFSPRGIMSFISSVPIWVKEKLFMKRNIRKELSQIGTIGKSQIPLLFPEHHLSHAASAFYPSPYQDAAILTIDGVGEWATASICHGQGNEIKICKELKFPHSLGLLYSAFTYFLGFKVNSGEYKMMGLAPYGNAKSKDYKRYREIITDHLCEIQDDGSIRLNQKYFNYATGLRMVSDKKWSNLFSLQKREPSQELTQQHMDLALAIQHLTEEIVIAMATEAKKLTQSDSLVLAGGVALNCVANGRLMETNLFSNIWIQPAAGDAGGSLGAALAAHHIAYGQPLLAKSDTDRMQGSYLGPEYSNDSVRAVIKQYKAQARLIDQSDDLLKETAHLIASGNVVGWFQGRMEFGPRALGHRSILGDPRDTEMQQKINLKIKYRESFRPFAPSVLREDVQDYFAHHQESPYMLVVKNISNQIALAPPEDYHQLDFMEKLRVNRSTLPAITHVDFSARIQTVDGVASPRYYGLIKAFKAETGVGVLINTSFNVRGEPIVCTPEDAYRCFMRTEMDYLVVNDYIFEKKQQPDWQSTDKWKEEFKLD